MTAPNLPVGVIRNNTDGVSRDLRNIDVLTVDEVAQLWTTYHSKQALLANDVGSRLANFFWRLWSSEHLRTSLAGTQVALLFEGISEGSIIRTTPKSSPRHSRIISASQSSIEEVAGTVEEVRRLTREPGDDSREPTPTPTHQIRDFAYPEDFDGGSRRSSREQTRPTPILKKPGSESARAGKTARIQPPEFKTRESDPAHDEPMSPEEAEELSRQLSDDSVVNSAQDGADDLEIFPTAVKTVRMSAKSPPAPSQPAVSQRMTRTSSGKGNSRGSRKKPSFVVGASRKRPTLSRRQSSQSSGGGTSKTSPGLKSSRTFDDIPSLAEVDSASMRRTHSGPGASAADAGHRLISSRSASPISQSPFHRVSKDHQAHEKDDSPAAVHNRAISSIAPGSEFVPLSIGATNSVDMRRSSSTASYKSSLASSSSSNIQASGQISVDQPAAGISTTPRRAIAVLGRAGSFLAGRGKAKPAFEIGSPETSSPETSRRSSVEIQSPLSPRVTGLFSSSAAASSSGIAPSRSQNQLSDLLDQERRRDAERDRRRAIEDERLQKGR